MHPSATEADLVFQADTGTNTNYNQTITSTYFFASHKENDSLNEFKYYTAGDLAQSTNFHSISQDTRNSVADQCMVGTLKIFNPSSTTFVKHFISECNSHTEANTHHAFTAGYFNTTNALTRFQFKFHDGNMDSGVIKMYGVG
jgi:regulator of PEP synthase PpsR (kinase-PPPase family)